MKIEKISETFSIALAEFLSKRRRNISITRDAVSGQRKKTTEMFANNGGDFAKKKEKRSGKSPRNVHSFFIH